MEITEYEDKANILRTKTSFDYLRIINKMMTEKWSVYLAGVIQPKLHLKAISSNHYVCFSFSIMCSEADVSQVLAYGHLTKQPMSYCKHTFVDLHRQHWRGPVKGSESYTLAQQCSFPPPSCGRIRGHQLIHTQWNTLRPKDQNI